ncbi:ABC transporter substrate-binding protein [Paenibacillus apiarius]|uniref:ABC transporter substrate-binding protein n=1 Tax=Paenibacillus apiarius TaxID=46240 RepID=A0ABT4E0Q9_9BACL|nr:ABC transporter substrate-binding protein [Paenibacillus apiarius]MCY9523191.1 ABC transporter substrate-binding protein [Paenibacillus apiarius]MCY9553190.1 ABC transporter substrate-binding protein [Paenibacillus apiarius]MCY9559632.1 ABC transporter substrate-binding protein [Paenibacillus apiarius]MCY9686524.1 ABC transporter substrate-binding protein [Paenibacillus apiarius]MCY9725167.1 ABC transporter substrate-binding protein [Paenibacillus apiarius]
MLGKEREAEAWLADYDKRITDARAKLDKVVPAEATFSIMEDWGKMLGVFGDNFGRGGQAIYQALGRKLPAKHAAEIMEQQSVEVSMEVIHEFAGDYIIFTSDKHTYADLSLIRSGERWMRSKTIVYIFGRARNRGILIRLRLCHKWRSSPHG